MTERLKEAIEAGELPPDLLVCGAAGTGKTYGILLALHCLANDNPGLRILICRATRASMTESVLVTYEQEILPADGMEAVASGVQRRVRQAYRYPNGSEIVLGGLDNPARILSTAWDVVYINEAIEVTEEAWETLQSRLGRPGRHPDLGYLIADTNPGDPSHWLKRRADAGSTTLWDTSHEANPRLHDGENWTAEGLSYLATLDRLTGSRKKRLRHGLWAAGEGAWFSAFDHDTHVSDADAEFDPSLPARLAIDCNGLHVAAVWWQERPGPSITVFGDYLSVDVPAESNAAAILQRSRDLGCEGSIRKVVADPAGKQRQGLNTTVFAEYQRMGLPLTPWPSFPGSVVTGLDLIESFLPTLRVHSRCKHLIAAMGNYMRAKRNNQWVDVPEDPQHPHEDLIDALRGGLMDRWPEGRKPDLKLPRVNPSRMF